MPECNGCKGCVGCQPWRVLGHQDPNALPIPDQSFPNLFGVKASIIRQSLAEMQEARFRTLSQDFDYMQAWEQAPDSYLVVNFRTLGRYEVDFVDYQCTCYDSFHTFTDEGSNLLCKHLVFVALIRKEIADMR